MVCVAVTYLVKEGTLEQAISLLRELAEASRNEPGCQLYLVHQSTDNPRQLFLYEQYDDQAALDAHRSTPHFERLGSNGVFPLLESRSPVIYSLLF